MTVPQIKSGSVNAKDFPSQTVYMSDALGKDWTVVDYLYVDALTMAVSPEVDKAEFSYLYGPICREPRGPWDAANYESRGLKLYKPLEILGKYVKVVIAGAANDGSDLTWYGILEIDEREPMGSGSNSLVPNPDPRQISQDAQTEIDRGEARGTQKLTAFGLIRLLELTSVYSAVVNQIVGEASAIKEPTVKIGQGLPFNSYRPGEFQDRGNRSTKSSDTPVEFYEQTNGNGELYGDGADTDTGLATDTVPDHAFVFSALPQRTRPWNAAHAVAYLLQFHAPADSSGTVIVPWDLTAGPDDLDAMQTIGWHDVSVNTDGRNLKEIIDELIGRRRGLGWFVTYSEDGTPSESGVGSLGVNAHEGSKGFATINVFSFNDKILDFGKDYGTQANPNQRSLNFENAFDIESCRITNSIASKYDRIVAMGHFKTSTCTLEFDPAKLKIAAEWTPAEEALFKTAASGDAGYAALDFNHQKQANATSRQRDQIRNVYRKFRLDAEAFFTDDIMGVDVNKYLVAPLVDENGAPIDNGAYNSTTQKMGEAIWMRGIKIMSKLPLKDRFDYSGNKIALGTAEKTTLAGDKVDTITCDPSFLPPIFFTKTMVIAPVQQYAYLDRLNDSGSLVADGIGYAFSVNASVDEQNPSFLLNVSSGQQFIAKTASAGLALTDGMGDPSNFPSLDFNNFYCTICLQLFDRVTQEATVVPRDEPKTEGRIERVLYIKARESRLDYVVPTTVVSILDGIPQQTTEPGYVRDDRKRLLAIATAAAEWYGRPRQTIDLKLKQAAEVVKLGWLITDVGPNYQLAHVNTPITSIAYDLLKGTTSFKTAHAEVEFE